MKRKKWSELEEQTLLQKYSDLLTTGTLAKLKTREKKFKPIADAVNAVHHHLDPLNFPFKWSWRDVSIKVQNMRHQYLGVKQKIRAPDGESFNWTDGVNHWENFLRYKEVFGDVEIDVKGKRESSNGVGDDDDVFGGDLFGLGFEGYSEDLEAEGDDDVGESYNGFCDERDGIEGKRVKKGLLGLVGGQVLELRDVVLRREEKRREREWNREDGLLEREDRKREREVGDDGGVERREVELEEKEMVWARREFERRGRLEREFDEERRRRRRMKVEEMWEEEEMEWRERMLVLQIEHEKQMMQMHVESCQNQMQVLGVMARLVCQFFGSANDGLGGGLGALPPQVLQNLQHPVGLGDNIKPDANSPSEFI